MNQESEEIYLRLSNELDLLKNNNSKFIYFARGKRRILVDKSEGKLYKPRFRIKNKYIELSFGHISFGRYLLGVTDNSLNVDHINKNPLDNRRCNLRLESQTVNLLNRKRFHLQHKYKGVIPRVKIFRIEVHSNYKTYTVSLPKTYSECECAVIYDCIALKLNGNYHETNFKKELYSTRSINGIYSQYENYFRIKDRSYRKLTKQIFKNKQS